MGIIVGVLEQGFIYGLVALGLYITYTILDFPDLTVDGTFPLGAAVSAALIAAGVNPYLALLVSFAAGGVAGMLTGLIHVKGGVRDLLSAIIMATALYSISLVVAGMRANVSFFREDTIFRNGFMQRIFPDDSALKPYGTLIVCVIIALMAKLVMDWYLGTKSGYLLRATGDNANVVTAVAKDSGNMKILGLAIANALVGLAGGMMAQYQRFYDVSMGTGTVVTGVASVIIGTNAFGRIKFMKGTSAVLIGSVLYKGCVAIAIALGLNSMFMNLITAVLFLLILLVSKGRKQGDSRIGGV